MPYQQPLTKICTPGCKPNACSLHPSCKNWRRILFTPQGWSPLWEPTRLLSIPDHKPDSVQKTTSRSQNKEICSKHMMFELLPPTLAVKLTASVLKLIPHMPRSCSTTIMQHRYHVMPCPTSAIWFCIVGAFDKGLNRLSLQRWCIEKLLDITKECPASSIHGQCLHNA